MASKYSPSGYLQEVCFADLTPQQLAAPNALLLLDGNLGRNAGVQPWTIFDDVRLSRRIISVNASAWMPSPTCSIWQTGTTWHR